MSRLEQNYLVYHMWRSLITSDKNSLRNDLQNKLGSERFCCSSLHETRPQTLAKIRQRTKKYKTQIINKYAEESYHEMLTLFLTFSVQSFIAVSNVCLVTSTLNPRGSSICCRSSSRDLQHQAQRHYILTVRNPRINLTMCWRERESWYKLLVPGNKEGGPGAPIRCIFYCLSQWHQK
jgi:hypothetical protein